MWIWFKNFFTDEYHDLKLTHKMSAGQMRYHISNDVVMTGYISSSLDNLTMAVTADQSHVEHLMEKNLQLMETKIFL